MIERYFDTLISNSDGEIADIESLAVFLGMTREELITMESSKELGHIIKLAKAKIAGMKKQLAFRGKIPAAVLSFDLKNNHGYRDKPEGESDEKNVLIIEGVATEWAD